MGQYRDTVDTTGTEVVQDMGQYRDTICRVW
jgi:hypothetical protein